MIKPGIVRRQKELFDADIAADTFAQSTGVYTTGNPINNK